MVKTIAPVSGSLRSVCRSERTNSVSPAFSAVTWVKACSGGSATQRSASVGATKQFQRQ
jgi:hypothetical protein